MTKRRNGTNKNDAFRIKYDLKHEQIKNILLKLTAMDFCYSMLDDHNSTEVLYVFGLTEDLWNTEEDCHQHVLIYIKTCYKESESFTVVISFHEAEYKLDYCFKN
ncbi:MAG: type II toxin-antitoxin system MqsR family toxin [Treponema sp.]|nr:type II toxin-antitoxin system MqsR family toxin [Treponema sp.]